MVAPIRQNTSGRERKTKMAIFETPPDYSVLRYDYSTIDALDRQRVMDAAIGIRGREKRVMQDLIEIGERLLLVKELLPHGQFTEWVQTEFAYSNGSLHEFMNMARRAAQISKFGNLGISNARLLSAPSVPDEAVEDALEAAENKGAPLSVAETKRIIDLHKAPPKMISVQATVTGSPLGAEPLSPQQPTPDPTPLDAMIAEYEQDAANTIMPADLAAAGYRLVKVSPTTWAVERGEPPGPEGSREPEKYQSNWHFDPSEAIEEARDDFIPPLVVQPAPEPTDAIIQRLHDPHLVITHVGAGSLAEAIREASDEQLQMAYETMPPELARGRGAVLAAALGKRGVTVTRATVPLDDLPVVESSQPEPSRAAAFDAWLRAMPNEIGVLNLRECLILLEVAKSAAYRVRTLEPDLTNVVGNSLPTLSQLINRLEKMVKR